MPRSTLSSLHHYQLRQVAMNTDQTSLKRRLDPLAALSLFLAVFIMVLPTEADLLIVLIHHKKLASGVAFCVICFCVVFTPFFFSWRKLRREPTKWRGNGYLIATGVILTMNLLFVVITFCHLFYR